jgi:hypothetical protein
MDAANAPAGTRGRFLAWSDDGAAPPIGARGGDDVLSPCPRSIVSNHYRGGLSDGRYCRPVIYRRSAFCRLRSDQANSRPTFGQLVKTHTFRFVTMIATWALILAAFFYHPEWIRAWLRLLTHSIETVADQIPEPWGARIEVMLRELGGMIWIQIASAIVLLRLILWVPFHVWQLRRDRNMPR